ncbi:uncharacterized protein LOC143544688 [Bidens hawaiensis]|uniref:uncharacterized protein LOC143544688 n=1 Tax=Bidens hawaiensis TaxID=980011 RepID=UPI004049851D
MDNNANESIKQNEGSMVKKGRSSGESNLKRSFKLGLNALLTTCSKEEFCKAFPRFTQAEKERLHRLYIQVIVSVHQNIEDEFEALCEETKVGDILGRVEELVEEQTLDPLYPNKTNLNDVTHVLSTLKEQEIQRLTTLLHDSEAQNQLLRRRVELLRKEIQDSSGIFLFVLLKVTRFNPNGGFALAANKRLCSTLNELKFGPSSARFFFFK